MFVLSTSSNYRVWSRFNFQLSIAHPLPLLDYGVSHVETGLCELAMTTFWPCPLVALSQTDIHSHVATDTLMLESRGVLLHRLTT